jgi:hypothetical protein
METDIAFEINFYFAIATTQLGGNIGIDQAPDFRISFGCFVGNAQLSLHHTIVFDKYTRVIYKLGPSWSLWFCLLLRPDDTYPLP